MSTSKTQIILLYNDDSHLLHGSRAEDVAIQSTVTTTAHLEQALTHLGYPVARIAVRDSLTTLEHDLASFPPQASLIFYNCDGFNGSNQASVEIVRTIEALGFPHTGATAESVALCTDKPRTKQHLLANHLPTPAFQVFKDPAQTFQLEFPVIVKPSVEDGSIGISLRSVVATLPALRRQVRAVLHTYQEPVLVEKFIAGRELAVALLGNRSLRVLPIAEDDYAAIADPLKRLLTYESKWDPTCDYYRSIPSRIPAALTPAEQRRVASVARRAFQVVGLRDLGRIDFRLQDGIPYIIDINEIPDLAPDAGFWLSAQAAGFTYPRLINQIVTSALRREGFLS